LSSSLTQISFRGSYSDKLILQELLSPWIISFTTSDKSDIEIAYKSDEIGAKKTIIVPHRGPQYNNWAQKRNLSPKLVSQQQIKVAITNKTFLSITHEIIYDNEAQFLAVSEGSSTEFFLNNDQMLLKVDLIKEFTNIINQALAGHISNYYHILTGLPVRYDVAPKKFRDIVMGEKKRGKAFDYCDKLPLDALRFMLVSAIERLSGKTLLRRKWKGATSCVMITHDIDTESGLRRSTKVRKLEEKYSASSTWYIPTRHYPLNREIIRELASYGEVGIHGEKHKGDLVRLSNQELYTQFSNARKTLEKISGTAISGFRSPLLQHNSRILTQLKKAGYSYDTSIPSWEPKHPQTMGPYGIGTVFPFKVNGLIEFPVSIIQDHQLLYILGFTPKKTLDQWLLFMDLIKEIGGCIVLLSHPEYKLFDSEHISFYENFLNTLTSDNNSLIVTPNQLIN
jgi:peptidoglycan/xylan/chitin deacetylase (PgdA/CDA1 family)